MPSGMPMSSRAPRRGLPSISQATSRDPIAVRHTIHSFVQDRAGLPGPQWVPAWRRTSHSSVAFPRRAVGQPGGGPPGRSAPRRCRASSPLALSARSTRPAVPGRGMSPGRRPPHRARPAASAGKCPVPSAHAARPGSRMHPRHRCRPARETAPASRGWSRPVRSAAQRPDVAEYAASRFAVHSTILLGATSGWSIQDSVRHRSARSRIGRYREILRLRFPLRSGERCPGLSCGEAAAGRLDLSEALNLHFPGIPWTSQIDAY